MPSSVMGIYGCSLPTFVCQFAAISLGTRCPPREQRLLVSCSPPPHQVIPEGPLEGQGREKLFA